MNAGTITIAEAFQDVEGILCVHVIICEIQNLKERLLQFCNLLLCLKNASHQEYRGTFVTKFPSLPNKVRIPRSKKVYSQHLIRKKS